VTTTFFVDKLDVPSKLNNINKIDAFKISSQGLISSSPLIIFAYMYQVFIPCLYEELETRTPKQMSKVMCSGSIVVLTCFCFLGTFGYATFASDLG
jgi:amino acid permease